MKISDLFRRRKNLLQIVILGEPPLKFNDLYDGDDAFQEPFQEPSHDILHEFEEALGKYGKIVDRDSFDGKRRGQVYNFKLVPAETSDLNLVDKVTEDIKETCARIKFKYFSIDITKMSA